MRDRALLLDTLEGHLQGLDMQSRYALCDRLLSSEEQGSKKSMSLLRVMITSLECKGRHFPNSRPDSLLNITVEKGDTTGPTNPRALLPILCDRLLKVKDVQSFSELSDCILLLLRDKVSQLWVLVEMIADVASTGWFLNTVSTH